MDEDYARMPQRVSLVGGKLCGLHANALPHEKEVIIHEKLTMKDGTIHESGRHFVYKRWIDTLFILEKDYRDGTLVQQPDGSYIFVPLKGAKS